ncbi:MAG: hypothetical protein ACK4N5_08810 [Myxococcales bacterium]
MRLNLLTLAALFLFTGCVINNRSDSPPPQPAPRPGHITFKWNFEGRGCLDVPEVQHVRVVIPNETLDNNGYFPCNSGGTDGIKLLDFAPGSYNFTIDGVDANNKTIYTISGTLNVNGDITVPVTLTRVGARERVQLFWTFGKAKKGCAAAGVDEVWVRFANGEQVTRPCNEVDPLTNRQVEGVSISQIDAGTYPVSLQGVIRVARQGQPGVFDRQVWYAATLNIPVVAGAANNYNVNLDDVAASVNYIPKFGDGRNCTSAGAQTIWVALFDKANRPVGTPAIFECVKVETAGITWDYLPAADDFDQQAQLWRGTYTIQMEAWDTPYTNHRVLYAHTATRDIYAGIHNTHTVTMIPK